jgi:hypothetical protein
MWTHPKSQFFRTWFTFTILFSTSAPAVRSQVPDPGASPKAETVEISSSRVSAAVVPVKFSLLGQKADVLLSPRSTAVVESGEHGTAAIRVESGDAVVTVKEGQTPVRLEGRSGGVTVKKGVGWYYRNALDGQEWGMVVEGTGTTHKGDATAATPAGVPVPMQPLNTAREIPEWMESESETMHRQASKWASTLASPDSQVSQLPLSIPQGTSTLSRFVQTADHRYWPITGGGLDISVPGLRAPSAQRSDTVTKYRSRMVVTIPGEGMGGAGFLFDVGAGESGHAQNLIWTGGTAFVRFQVPPNWTATLAPRSIVSVDAASGYGGPGRLQLHSGAMLLEGGVSKAGTAGFTQVTGGIETPLRQALGRESYLYAVPDADAQEPGPVALHRARTQFEPLSYLSIARQMGSRPRPKKTGNTAPAPSPVPDAPPRRNHGEVVCYTLLTNLPASQASVGRYLPLHVAGGPQVGSVEIGMISNQAPGTPAVGMFSLYQMGNTMAPDALVMPLTLAHTPGPSPENYMMFLSSAESDVGSLAKSAKHVGKNYTHEEEVSPSVLTPYNIMILVSCITGGLLFLIPAFRMRLSKLLRLLTGLGFTHCSRCDLILNLYPIGEFDLRKSHETLMEIVHYDVITDANQQVKSRNHILDWLRTKSQTGPVPRFRFLGSWCQRCLQGAIRVEVIANEWVVDEADWSVAGADTHKLLELMEHPELALAADKDARAKR